MVLPAGALMAALGFFDRFQTSSLRALGWIVIGVSAVVLVGLVWGARRPRLACVPGYLLIYLRSGGPVRVPIDVVEGFLLDRGASLLPGKRCARFETATVVIRLAERAEEWATLEVKPALGSWCNHYVTIRGTWCEPLSVKVVNRLNARLAQAKARRKPRRLA